jgi:omega-6 fatty acid desaturase (delta-12 desaturase)
LADFALLCAYLLVFVGTLFAVGGIQAVLLGFVIPFVVWNYAMGMTIYLHHTHPQVPWFRDTDDKARAEATNTELSLHVKFPGWWNLITHNIYYHPAHHFSARIPLYRLKAAQAELGKQDLLNIKTEKFSLAYLWRLTQQCQLYDYATNNWQTFHEATSSKGYSNTKRALLARTS